MNNFIAPRCAACPYEWRERACHHLGGKGPPNCPTLLYRKTAENSIDVLKDTNLFEFARQASIQEAEGYGGRELGYEAVRPIKPRIVEVMEFAHRMQFKRIALVFCIGLRSEAAVVLRLFEKEQFDVLSIACKAGRIPKESIGITEEQKVAPYSNESICNPVFQALLANEWQSQLNVLLGLCVGHDSLFLKYAGALSTVLAVKDRLLGHNPLAAIYQCDLYYRYLKQPLEVAEA
jgi:uncharacterized metal-binding protein